MPLELYRYRFKPRLLPSIMSIGFMVVFVFLGRWQWQRADYKENLQKNYSRGEQSLPLSIDSASAFGADVNSFPIVIEGRFDNDHSVLLDNQVENGVAGFQVLTPFTTTVNSQMVLVGRGWIPLGKDRAHFTTIPLIDDKYFRLKGQIYFPGNKQFVLQNDNFTDKHWPLLVQKLDIPKIGKALGVELPPFVVRLDADQQVETGPQMPRHWHFMVMGPEKSRGYSFQWYGMAIVLFMFYIFFSVEKVTGDDKHASGQ